MRTTMINDMHSQTARMEATFKDKLADAQQNVLQAETDLCKRLKAIDETMFFSESKEREEPSRW